MKKIILIAILTLAAVLRLLWLNSYPSGLNADEAAIGYNAYSLLQTGKDEHGNSWPLVFRSFDDYKPPLYFYLVLPFVKAFGLNIWSVRLPSALLGIATVLLAYLLVNQLFPKKSPCLGLWSAFFLAISPWHLHFSRGGWEANTAAFFLILAVWSFVKGLKNSRYFYLSSLSIVLSLYTYHSIRIIAPLLGLSLIIIYRQPFLAKLKSKSKPIILSFLLLILLLIPLTKQLLSKEGQSRFSGVSVFSDQGPLWEALALRREHRNDSSLTVRLIHNRYLTYTLRFAKNYLSHFSPQFLFISGDEIGRNKVPEMGQSYSFLVVFFILGLWQILKTNTPNSKFILSWLLISPLAAALTFQSPHALRGQNMTIPFNIIIALGTYSFFIYLKSVKAKTISISLALFFVLALSYSLAKYLHQYYVHYPKEIPYAWEYGFDQVASYISKNQNQYDQIIISDRYDQPYIILAFYLKYPPSKLQQEIELTPRDKFGFSTVRKFDKFKFRPINYDQDKNLPQTLLIATEEPVPEDKVIHTIQSPLDQTIFKFVKTN